jgi:hypothetical protein
MKEIWKDIKGYEGCYQISNKGRIKSFLKILSCGSGIESQDKQKRGKALPLGESMTHEAHPIALGVGG